MIFRGAEAPQMLIKHAKHIIICRFEPCFGGYMALKGTMYDPGQ